LSNNLGRLRVVIPARYASTRLPGKPLIDLAGLPMIIRVYRAVRSAFDSSDDVVVATDDRRIADVLFAHGVGAVVTSDHHASGTDRVAEAARSLGWSPEDLVLNVQGDEPLVPPKLLRAFADFCFRAEGLSMATVASPLNERSEIQDSNVVKVILNSEGYALLFSRSAIPFCRDIVPDRWQPATFLRHIGIYGYRNRLLQRLTTTPVCDIERLEKLEQLRALWLGIPVSVMGWDSSPPPGVDTQTDADRVTAIIRSIEGKYVS
jgi:3-deoxy-manno-octulosonate cytidylyltransferase (CMP-KDO synthetase)